MFFLSKLLQPLLFPPGCFLVFLWFIILFIALGKRKLAVVLSGCMMALLYLVSIGPTSQLFMRPLEDEYSALKLDAVPTADCIVVLGGGTVQGSPEESSQTGNATAATEASLVAEALKRLVYGYKLHQRTGLPILVSGGTVFRAGSEPEALAAKRLLLELGIPEDKIFMDSDSRNTWENAVNVRGMLGIGKTIILVTSAYHMKRSVACFEANGLVCVPAPTDYKLDRAPFNLSELLPSAESLKTTAAALREYWGLAYYKISYFHK